MGQGHVAKAGGRFRRSHGFVDGDAVVAREIADEAQHFANGDAGLMAAKVDVRDDDGARVDEGISRDALFMLKLDDGVEGIAGGFPPYPLPKLVADLAERDRKSVV